MKTVKRIWESVTNILVALVVVLAVLLVGARLVGFQVFTVLSGSMEPTYHTGSLIYVKDVDYKEIEAGQVITFMLDEDTVATHRVVEVVPDETDSTVLRYRTKGDANDAEDGSLVHYKNVLGSPVFSIPKLGYLANFIQNPPGMYIAISAGAILLLLVFLPDLLFEDEKEGEEKKAKDNAPFGTYTFNELDAFDELEHTETDPEKLLKILEYGLPDEELETIIKKLESGK